MSQKRPLVDRIRTVVVGLDVGWWAFALVVATVIAFVGWVYLPWVVFGLFVYYVARPIEWRLERWIPSKNVSAATTLLVVVLPIVVILGAAILVTIAQLSTFLTDEVVATIDALLPIALESLPRDPTELAGQVVAVFGQGTLQTVFSSVTRTVGSVAEGLFNAFLSLLFAFFLLREDDRLAGWFHANLAAEDSSVSRYLAAVDEGLQSVYFGYTVTIFVVMVLAALIYSGFNLVAPADLAIPSPIALAVITGIFTIVPLVGRSIVYAVVTGYLVLVALRTNPASLWFPLVFLVVMELPFDNLIRVYVRPRLSGKLFPMSLIVFAYLLGPPLFGWYGIFYGPFLMVVVVLFLQMRLPRMVHPSRGDTATSPAVTGPADEHGTRVADEQLQLDETGTDTTRTGTR